MCGHEEVSDDSEKHKKDHEMTAASASTKPTTVTATDTTETVTDDRKSSSNEEVEAPLTKKGKAAVQREDAVDISLQEHVNEVVEDTVTNPVEQAKKRARTSPGQGGFLAQD